MDSYSNLKKLSDKNGEVEFRAEVSLGTVLEHERYTLQEMGRNFSIPGFRKGKVPENILRENVDPAHLVEEAAESAVRDAIRDIADSESINAIGTPKVSVETLAQGKPIVFKVRFAIEPEAELPDYKNIAKEILSQKKEAIVTEKEVDDSLNELRTMTMQVSGEKELPELNDAFAEKFGGVKTIAALKEEIKKELTRDKERKLRDEQRNEAIKAVVQKSKLTIPEMLAEQELAHFLEHRNAELERLGMTRDAYLKEVKKTEKELEKEDRAAIEERIRTSFVFRKIQEMEKISASQSEIAAEVNFLRRRYPNEDPQNIRRTAEAAIIEGKIFKALEPVAETVAK